MLVQSSQRGRCAVCTNHNVACCLWTAAVSLVANRSVGRLCLQHVDGRFAQRNARTICPSLAARVKETGMHDAMDQRRNQHQCVECAMLAERPLRHTHLWCFAEGTYTHISSNPSFAFGGVCSGFRSPSPLPAKGTTKEKDDAFGSSGQDLQDLHHAQLNPPKMPRIRPTLGLMRIWSQTLKRDPTWNRSN